MPMDYGTNFRAQKVDIHEFSMVPRADIPRSKFRMQSQHKTTFSASGLIPVFVQEVLPGDTFNVKMTAFVRMATPIYPLMDQMDLESWFFFVPCRLVWQHWPNFMGEQPASPSDSISYNVPQIVSPSGGFAAFSLYDYFGIPGANQITAGGSISVNALPFRAYAMIWNQWFRDQNLDGANGYGATGTVYDLGDGPDPFNQYPVQTVRKRHDYFTSGLPWTQKGGVAITLPLGTQAIVRTASTNLVTGTSPLPAQWLNPSTGTVPNTGLATMFGVSGSSGQLGNSTTAAGGAGVQGVYPANLYADLSTATAATINQIRLAFQTQRLLERDARSGTRYTEVIRAHFGVLSPDMRLQRPEYLGGGKSPVNVVPVPQTGGTGASGTTSPLGTLAAVGTAVAHNHGFRQSFTEHGYVLGLVAVRADQIYNQGMRRMWTRQTRYDFYWPVFAMLGEQGIRNDEIYASGTALGAQDTNIFAYQERWAEYRYMPSIVSGAFRTTYGATLDSWHLAVAFAGLPALNSSFISDPTGNTLARCLAAGGAAANEQFLADLFFDVQAARPMPMYSVPGMIDHF